MENKTRRKRINIILIIILLTNVSMLFRNERLSTIRTVDMLSLIACGMLIGALIANVVSLLRNKE